MKTYGTRRYRGIWQPNKEPEITSASKAQGLTGALVLATEPEFQDLLKSSPAGARQQRFLLYQLSLLHRVDHRQQLGRKLLLLPLGGKTQLLLNGMGSFGWNYRPWAHARLFALANYLNVELPPEILPSLRHPWHLFRYLHSTFWLWSLLGLVARKELRPQPSQSLMRLTRMLPPLFIWQFERQLQSILGQNQNQTKGWQARTPSSS